jgi:deoxyribonuclease IV
MEITKKNPLLGAHVSIAGNVKNAIFEGERLGCTAIQIFTANNRRWSSHQLLQRDIEEFFAAKNASSIQIVISHCSYLINLGSPQALIAKKSKQALEMELIRCHQLNIPYVVIHPGAHLESNKDQCMGQISNHIDEILDKMGGKCHILLENTAGQGSTLGHTFEQLATIRDQIRHKQWVGFCFDTCHAAVAGYNFTHEEGYREMWRQFDTTLGLEYLKVIHVNDSKKPIGSRVDRHEHIGQGLLGIQSFSLIMNDNRFIHIPKIVETPHEQNGIERDLQILRSFSKN